jgi:hypothetical protein
MLSPYFFKDTTEIRIHAAPEEFVVVRYNEDIYNLRDLSWMTKHGKNSLLVLLR